MDVGWPAHEYRPLGRTGVMVSPLCLGTMNFGARTPPAEVARIVDRALDGGINFVDTANRYGEGGPAGPRTVEQLEDSPGAAELELDEDDLRRLDEVTVPRANLWHEPEPRPATGR